MFYQQLFDKIDTVISSALLDNVSTLIDFMNPIFRSMLVIYVAWWGISCIIGVQGDPLKESFFRTFKIAVILTCALNMGTYNTLVKDFLCNGPEELARVFLNTDSGALDTVLTKGIDVGVAVWDKAGTFDFALNIIALIIMGATIIVTAFAAFLLLLCKIAIGILVAVGPIFICMTIFETTKKYFEAWLGQAMNFFLLYVLVFAALGLFINMYEAFITSLNSEVGLGGVAQLVVFSICFVLVMRQVPSVASALGGGTQLSTLGGFGGSLARAGGLARGIRPTNIRRGVSTVKRDVRTVRSAGSWAANVFRKRSGGAS